MAREQQQQGRALACAVAEKLSDDVADWRGAGSLPRAEQ